MIEKRHIVNLKGKDYPVWAGVLDAATKAGLKSLVTRVIQLPTKENDRTAVVMARAEFEDGRVFEDVGDASPANCSAQIAAAAIRMASTRAKGRTLRDALNIGETMYEELPDHETAHNAARNAPEPKLAASGPPHRAKHDPQDETQFDDPQWAACEWPDCPRRVPPDQEAKSREHVQKCLCVNHEAQLIAVRARKAEKAKAAA